MYKIDREIAMKAKTWPFEEARKVLDRLGGKVPEKGYVLFETGYGPSGLPHIGTFGEVCRTSMVRFAFQQLSDIPTRLICFSDDMDGFRKIPDNIPNKDMLKSYVEEKDSEGNVVKDPTPLTSVPDPFEKFESFAHHNNAKLCEFLDAFGFDYEFVSSTDSYKSGRFNDALVKMLEKHEEVTAAVGKILGEERRGTYCPIFPIVDWADETSPIDNRKKVLHNVKITKVVDLEKGIAEFEVLEGEFAGKVFEHCILNGGCKAQWRPDWALRWFALDVDYEMAGEDLISSADIAGNVTRILGGKKPVGFHYKLFLDEHNQKISKSKGNGITVEEWLRYAPNESLSYYMYQRPTSGKKLYFDVIPKAVDEYISFAEKMAQQTDEPEKLVENAAYYIHEGKEPPHTPINFALLLNLASAANAHNSESMWGFINRYKPDATPENAPFLDHLVGFAVRYYEDFVLPEKQYRMADDRERAALADLAKRLAALPEGADFDAIQTEVFSAGKENGYDKSELREWFKAIYEVLLGQSQGPRFGAFIEIYGVQDTITLITDALDGKFAKAA